MKFSISPFLLIMFSMLIIFGFYIEAISYFFVILLHELAHAYVAKKLGYSLNKLKLAPYGAQLTGSIEGIKWQHEAMIALAGPIINIMFAFVFVALWWVFPVTYLFSNVFVTTSVFTAIFNLIPIYPLDGGRALLAILSSRLSRKKAYRILKVFGVIFAVILNVMSVIVLIFGHINPSFILVSLFIFSTTIIPDKNSKYERIYSMTYRTSRLKKGLQVKELMIDGEMTIIQIIKLLNPNHFSKFIIVDKSFKKLGEINELELESLSITADKDIGISKLLKRD
ncbi:MAG: site-2 protease family protein [Firmicutes bacterium]|nr:site-2 protease family protein [Bacillota bacterium]